jgi:hypothetical protein
MMEAIGELEPVSISRLGVTRRSFRTFSILVKEGLVEYYSRGMFGVNWKLSDKGRRFVPVAGMRQGVKAALGE